MHLQIAEPLCVRISIGQSSLVSFPSEFVPKRINWAKWADGIEIAMRVKKNRHLIAPRFWSSTDHLQAKDNMSFMSAHSQSGIEQVDLFKLINTVSEESKFLFVGSWAQPLPSWFRSLQAVFSAKYSTSLQDMMAKQVANWSILSEGLESTENFLVIDDVGRLSALSGIAKVWRSRQERANILAEPRSNAWFAATLELSAPKVAGGQIIRLHRLQVFKPEQWCGSPDFAREPFSNEFDMKTAEEVWISAPGGGMSLWLADQGSILNQQNQKIYML